MASRFRPALPTRRVRPDGSAQAARRSADATADAVDALAAHPLLNATLVTDVVVRSDRVTYVRHNGPAAPSAWFVGSSTHGLPLREVEDPARPSRVWSAFTVPMGVVDLIVDAGQVVSGSYSGSTFLSGAVGAVWTTCSIMFAFG